MRTFNKGDRVVISQTPVDGSDKQYSGRTGVVEAYTHHNDDMEVYTVLLDGDSYPVSFYDRDMLVEDGLEVLRMALTDAEAEVIRLKASIKLKERDASKLPIATVVIYKDAFGPAAITKQAENVWLNVFPTSSGNVNTETLTDDVVTATLTDKPGASIRKP